MNKAWEREMERDVLLKMNTRSAEFMGYKDILQKPEDEEDKKITKAPYMEEVGNSLPGEKIIKGVKTTG